MSETVKHKSLFNYGNDPAKLPFRSAWCDEEYHFEVMKTYWDGVTCPFCLSKRPKQTKYERKKELEQQERTRPLPLPKSQCKVDDCFEKRAYHSTYCKRHQPNNYVSMKERGIL